jgi:hypothetical protein
MAGGFKITKVKGGYKVTSPNGHVLSKHTTKDKAQGQIKIIGGANKKKKGKK